MRLLHSEDNTEKLRDILEAIERITILKSI